VNVHEVKRTIRRGNEAAAQARMTLGQVAAEAAATMSLAQLTLQGSRDGDVVAALKIIESMDDEVDRAVRRADAAIKHANAYLATIG
jgi:hypothetical protein